MTVVAGPSLTTIGATINVTITDNLNFQVTANMYCVFVNSFGEVVKYETYSITLLSGQSLPSYFIYFLLPGQYNASNYAVIPDGWVVSNTTTIQFLWH